MYSSKLHPRDRSGAIAAALAIQAALLIAFLNMAGGLGPHESETALQLVKVPVPIPPPPVVEQRKRGEPGDRGGGSGSSKPKSKPSNLVLAPPTAAIPTSVAAAAVKPPPAGGMLTGTSAAAGNGGAGSGNGDGAGSGMDPGDGGGAVEPPHLATRVLSGYDFGPDLVGHWPPSATIFLRLKINSKGFISECMVDRGTNVPSIDSEMCNLAHERLRFWPALNRSGQAVPGWFGYAQPAPR